MSGQEISGDFEEHQIPDSVRDTFGNNVIFGLARNLDQVSVYVWGEYQQTPLMFNLDKMDEVINLMIDKKVDAEKERTQYLNKDDEMYVADCCNRIVYGIPTSANKCIYCLNDN